MYVTEEETQMFKIKVKNGNDDYENFIGILYELWDSVVYHGGKDMLLFLYVH